MASMSISQSHTSWYSDSNSCRLEHRDHRVQSSKNPTRSLGTEVLHSEVQYCEGLSENSVKTRDTQKPFNTHNVYRSVYNIHDSFFNSFHSCSSSFAFCPSCSPMPIYGVGLPVFVHSTWLFNQVPASFIYLFIYSWVS